MKARSLCLVFLLFLMLVVMSAMPAACYDRKVVVSTNPFLDMYTWFNGEVELAVSPNATIGVAGNYITFGDIDDEDDEENFTNVGVLFRYYPREAFGGFYFGIRGGYYGVTKTDWQTEEEETASAFGLGFDLGYSWVLGANERFYVGLGAGMMRLFGGDLEDLDVSVNLPIIRIINVGLAF